MTANVISGRAYWAKILKADEKFTPCYKLDLALDSSELEQVKKEFPRFKIKNKGDERGDFVTLKRNKFKKNGQELPRPRLVDASKKDYTGYIGNGSKVNVQFHEETWTVKGGGSKFVLDAVQIVELVEFKPEMQLAFDDVSAATEQKAPEPTNDLKE